MWKREGREGSVQVAIYSMNQRAPNCGVGDSTIMKIKVKEYVWRRLAESNLPHW